LSYITTVIYGEKHRVTGYHNSVLS
jgi:hypothetical protein